MELCGSVYNTFRALSGVVTGDTGKTGVVRSRGVRFGLLLVFRLLLEGTSCRKLTRLVVRVAAVFSESMGRSAVPPIVAVPVCMAGVELISLDG